MVLTAALDGGSGLSVELVVVPDCPNEEPAAALLRTALDDVGLRDVTFTTTVIATQATAEARRFIGSPTILLDGIDPFEDSTRMPALACRIYVGADGLGGLPDLRALRQALKRSAHLALPK